MPTREEEELRHERYAHAQQAASALNPAPAANPLAAAPAQSMVDPMYKGGGGAPAVDPMYKGGGLPAYDPQAVSAAISAAARNPTASAMSGPTPTMRPTAPSLGSLQQLVGQTPDYSGYASHPVYTGMEAKAGRDAEAAMARMLQSQAGGALRSSGTRNKAAQITGQLAEYLTTQARPAAYSAIQSEHQNRINALLQQVQMEMAASGQNFGQEMQLAGLHDSRLGADRGYGLQQNQAELALMQYGLGRDQFTAGMTGRIPTGYPGAGGMTLAGQQALQAIQNAGKAPTPGITESALQTAINLANQGVPYEAWPLAARMEWDKRYDLSGGKAKPQPQTGQLTEKDVFTRFLSDLNAIYKDPIKGGYIAGWNAEKVRAEAMRLTNLTLGKGQQAGPGSLSDEWDEFDDALLKEGIRR